MPIVALALLAACSPDKGRAADDTAAAPTPDAPWPDWAFQPWVWEDESTQDSALALVDGYLARDIPVGAIIIDSPWETGYQTYEFDPELYPDPQGLIDGLHERGVRVMLWMVPGINTDEAELYDYAAERGWFMQTSATSGPTVVDWWKGEGSLIDYWNPDAVAWWHGLLGRALDLGIDGWKCDGLDYYQIFAPYSPAAGDKVSRLDYSHRYYQDTFDYTRERLGEDRLITARPVDNYGFGLGGDGVAFSPVEIGWAGWVGDQDATFEGLRAALDNYYYSAEYGYVAFGSDIGGYRDTDEENGRSKELFIRWAQIGALSPVMENGGGGNHHPWAWDEETADIYRELADTHVALIPYLTEAGGAAFAEGRSLLAFQSRDTYAYLLGPDLFVAPVLEEGGGVSVTFPADGEWAWLSDPARTWAAGDTADLVLAIDEVPAFVRVGSALSQTLAAR